MNISIPDQMKSWVESRSADGKYSNNSDYVRDLIRRDQILAEKIEVMRKSVDEARTEGGYHTDIDAIRQEGRKLAKT